MKRQLILGLVLVLMILIGFATYYFVDSYQTKQSEESAREAAALQLTNFSYNDVTKLDLHTPDFDYTIEIDEDTSNWAVTEGDELYINTYYINILCNYGCSLTASESLGQVDSATLEKYGLEDPISITYYTESSTNTIYIGSQTSTGEYFYMMVDGSDEVYLVDASTAGYLAVNETQLRNRYVVEDSTSDFTELYLQVGDEVIYDLEYVDNAWEMTVPYSIPISLDGSKISSLSITLQELEIDDFGDSDITEEDYAEYGFDEPAYTYHFEQTNGNSVTLLFSEYDPLVTSYVNCLHVETGEIYIFESSYLSFLQAETSDYMLSTLYNPSLSEIAEMEISYSGSFNDTTLDFDISFTVDYENSTYTCDDTDFSDAEDVVTAFEDVYEKATNLTYESIQKDADESEYSDEDAVLKITYTLTDGTIHTVALIPYEDNNYWAYIDDEFSYVVVRQKTLSGKGKLLECYTTFIEALESAEL